MALAPAVPDAPDAKKSVVMLQPHPELAGFVLATVKGPRMTPEAWQTYLRVGRYDPKCNGRYAKIAELGSMIATLGEVPYLLAEELRLDATERASARAQRIVEASQRADAADQVSGRALYPFQADGVRWLSSRANALLADEMGTGKTAQALLASTDRLIVVCPSSLKRNWVREAALWRPDLRPVLLDAIGGFRWPDKGEMIVLGYELLPATPDDLKTFEQEQKAHEEQTALLASSRQKELAALTVPCRAPGASCAPREFASWSCLKDESGGCLGAEQTSPHRAPSCETVPERKVKPFDPRKACHLRGDKTYTTVRPENVTLVADEGHAFKGSVRKTDRVERFRWLAAQCAGGNGHVWVLTATPMLNKPPELWNVAMCAGVAQEAFGSFKRFMDLAGGIHGEYAIEWHPGDMHRARLAQCLAPVMLRRLKKDVLAHLPPKLRQTVTVSVADLPGTEQKALAEGLDALASGTLETLLEALQRTDDSDDPNALPEGFPTFRKLSKALAVLGKRKADASADLIESYELSGEPLVVFTTHQSTVDALKKRPGWVGFHGGTPLDERQAAVDAFQSGEAKGIVITIVAGGVGITLTRARTALFLERSWTPALDAQAEDRIHRIGQEADQITYVTVIADHPLDDRITALQARKAHFVRPVDGAARGVTEVAYVPQAPAAALPAGVDLDAWKKAFAVEEAEARAERDRERAARKGKKGKGGAPAGETAEARLERHERRRAQRRAALREAQSADPTRKVAETAEEIWLVRALSSLAASDADRATEKNGVGFAASTSPAGHALVWTADLGWTPDQWKEAAGIARHHKGQVGTYVEALREAFDGPS